MESEPTALEAAAALQDADRAGTRLARRIVTPPAFFTSLAAAVAIQIATTAIALGEGTPWVLVAGLAAFTLIAGVQLLRFRAANGLWLGGLASRVVLGTATTASGTYVVALGLAIWAAYAGLAWLAATCAVLGGGAYAVSGRRWLTTYRARPSVHARGEPVSVLAALAILAVAGLVVLLVSR